MDQNPPFSVLGSCAILQFDSHDVICKALIPTIATLFFVANLFQPCLNKLTVLLRISTLPEMSANLSILSMAKTVLEHGDSHNQHAIINYEQTTVIVLLRGGNSVLKIFWSTKTKKAGSNFSVSWRTSNNNNWSLRNIRWSMGTEKVENRICNSCCRRFLWQ